MEQQPRQHHLWQNERQLRLRRFYRVLIPASFIRIETAPAQHCAGVRFAICARIPVCILYQFVFCGQRTNSALFAGYLHFVHEDMHVCNVQFLSYFRAKYYYYIFTDIAFPAETRKAAPEPESHAFLEQKV